MARMKDRGASPYEVGSLLLTSTSLVLLKNQEGYEIVLPSKGRLVGDFENDKFVCKSFLLPFRVGKDYNSNGRKSRSGYDIRVSSVSFPGKSPRVEMSTSAFPHGMRHMTMPNTPLVKEPIRKELSVT
jgi:hypothetical protein